MNGKIFACRVCDRELNLKEGNSIMQIKYRTIAPNGIWESKWNGICPACSKDFIKWLNHLRTDIAEGDDLE